MKKSKKFAAWILAAVTALSVTGCTGGRQMAGAEDPNTFPEEPYEINWYINSQPQDDMELIEAEVNKILQEKINATLNITAMDSAQYKKRLDTMISSGEYFDLAFTSSSVLSYVTNTRAGAFFDMAPYVDEYMPQIKALFPESFFSTAYVDGMLGAVPVYKELAGQIGWYYRKDIAEKYNIDMTQYKTLEELEPVLEMLKEKEPGIEYPMEWDTSAPPQNLMSYTMTGTDCVMYHDENGMPTGVYESFPDSEQFKKFCETTRRYYEKGLVKPGVLTDSDATARMKNGKAFVSIGALKPGGAAEKFAGSKYSFDQAGVSRPKINSATSAMIGLSATSKNPYRVMRFLEILYTDPEVSNLLIHGIEGKHYTKVSDNTIEKIPNSGYDLVTSQWMMGNTFLNYLTTSDDPQKNEKLLAFNDEAIFNPAVGFKVDNAPIELELVAVNGVKSQFRNQAVLGAVDPDTVIPEYSKRAKEAGIDKVVAEVQRQYDEYIKTLK